MIKIICGPKGAGKTKQIIQLANTNAAAQKGLSVQRCGRGRAVRLC